MFDTPITLREIAMRQSPPLSAVFSVVYDYLREHDGVVLFGSHAVNVYVEPPRMTSDIDIMASNAEAVAEDIRELLARTFHIAVRVRVVAGGEGFRVYQIAEPKNRHFVDVRHAAVLPPSRLFDSVAVIDPIELVLAKLGSYTARCRTPKGLTDKVDLHRLLAAFPELLEVKGPIDTRLRDAPDAICRSWEAIRSEDIEADDDDAW